MEEQNIQEQNTENSEETKNIEYTQGVLDTATSLFKTILDMDTTMQKGEETILLTLHEKAKEATDALANADDNKVNYVIGVISTVVDTVNTVLASDTNTAKHIIQLLSALNDKMAEVIKELK